jgi:hypothetical protein
MEMKKATLALSAATALAAATIGLAAPAMAQSLPGGPAPLDCSVHVFYQGSNVDVNWC